MSDCFMDINKVKEYLPHRYPFLMIDKVKSYNKEEISLVALKAVTGNEEYFNGHFPNHPVMPGVLMIEAMAQAGGLLYCLHNNISAKDNPVYFMSIENAKFRKPVYPGSILEITINMLQSRGTISKVKGRVLVDGEIVSEMVGTAMVRK